MINQPYQSLYTQQNNVTSHVFQYYKFKSNFKNINLNRATWSGNVMVRSNFGVLQLQGLGSGYCMCGVWHVLPMPTQISSHLPQTLI